MAVGAVLSWAGLGLQFALMLQNHVDISTGEAVMRFFSFFTILTNILVALGFTFPLVTPSSFAGRFFAAASARGATAVYIVIVSVTYSLLLRHLFHLQGLGKLADELVHDVVPVFYVVYWFLFAPKSSLRWKDAVHWLLCPLAYMLYTLLHGLVSGWYPYPFVGVNALGYPRVLIHAVVFIAIFFGLGLLIVAIGRWQSDTAIAALEEAG
jgi:hypothetical protein